MQYIKVAWRHNSAEDPVLLLSELDAGRMEVRKVEVFPGGTNGWAGLGQEHGGTHLGAVPIPSIAEINTDPQFHADLIEAVEFEEYWQRARSGA